MSPRTAAEEILLVDLETIRMAVLAVAPQGDQLRKKISFRSRPAPWCRLPAVLLTSVLSGCVVGPNFESPHPKLPANFFADAPPTQGAPYVSGDAVDPLWWSVFNDPELTKLESLAVNSIQEHTVNVKYQENEI